MGLLNASICLFTYHTELLLDRIVAKLFPEADEPYSSIKANRRNWSRLRDVYKRRKPESTSSLEVFEDDSLEEELEKDES